MTPAIPKFRFWAGLDPYSRPSRSILGRRYNIGFWLFAKPESEQREGEYIRAKVHVELRIALPSVQWTLCSEWETSIQGMCGVVDSELWTGRRPPTITRFIGPRFNCRAVFS